jgi:phosphatidylglycerophosphate synthase
MVDCWLDRVLHRRLSRPVSAVAVRIGVSPNLITLGSLGAGLAAAGSLTAEGLAVWSLAVPLYLVAVVLDHSDGEVARLTGRTSLVGHRLDLAVDTLVHLALVLAMGAVAERVGFWAGNELGVSAAVGVVLSAATASAWPLGEASRGGNAHVGRVLDGLANRQGFYGILLVFMLCRALAPGLLPTLMVVLAVGSNAYWIGRVAVAVALRTGRGPQVAADGAAGIRGCPGLQAAHPGPDSPARRPGRARAGVADGPRMGTLP